jgi:hypothetical protein
MKIDEQAFAEQHLGKDSKEKKLPDINDVLDLSILLHHPGVKQVCLCAKISHAHRFATIYCDNLSYLCNRQAPVFIPPVDATNSEMPKIAKAPGTFKGCLVSECECT